MKMIVGLGNPGREYAATRHNLGFMVVDEVARRLSAGQRRTRFRAELAEAFVDGQKLVLLKPQTFMNLSGTAVREAALWYKIPPAEILVVVDDIDLPFGALRMRGEGGSGGHNGLKSIIADLGTEAFPRFRMGIGRGREPRHAAGPRPLQCGRGEGAPRVCFRGGGLHRRLGTQWGDRHDEPLQS